MILRKLYLRLIGDYPCARFVEAVTEYFEGTMPADERTRFERHVKRCASCRIYIEQLRQTIEESGRVTVADVESLPEQARNELLETFRTFHAER